MQVSKNYNKGNLIKSIDTVCELAQEGKSIYVELYKKVLPAAFLQNYPAYRLHLLVNGKSLYQIEKI